MSRNTLLLLLLTLILGCDPQKTLDSAESKPQKKEEPSVETPKTPIAELEGVTFGDPALKVVKTLGRRPDKISVDRGGKALSYYADGLVFHVDAENRLRRVRVLFDPSWTSDYASFKPYAGKIHNLKLDAQMSEEALITALHRADGDLGTVQSLEGEYFVDFTQGRFRTRFLSMSQDGQLDYALIQAAE